MYQTSVLEPTKRRTRAVPMDEGRMGNARTLICPTNGIYRVSRG